MTSGSIASLMSLMSRDRKTVSGGYVAQLRGPIRLAAVVALTVLSIPLYAGRDTGMQRGFSADGLYNMSNVDAINSFSGNLTATIPIGPQFSSSGSLKYQFRLVYNSNVWDYIERSGADMIREGLDSSMLRNFTAFDKVTGTPDGDGVEAVPARHANAGLGWMLSLGEVQTRYALNGVAQVVYVASDGSEHAFYNELHGSANEVQRAPASDTPLYLYARDNSYLRMRIATALHPRDHNWREIQFPDGIVQRFHCVKDCETLYGQWVLKEMGDPFGNLLVVDRNSAEHKRPAVGASWVWTFIEYFSSAKGYKRAGDAGLTEVRRHTLKFKITSGSQWVPQMRLEEVRLPALADGVTTDAVYTLQYRPAEVFRDKQSSWWDGLLYPRVPPSDSFVDYDDMIAVSLLQSVSLPQNNVGTAVSGQWKMSYWGDNCAKTGRPGFPACDATDFFSLRHWGNKQHRVNAVFGRLKQLSYPAGNGVQYEYSNRGYPQKDRCNPAPGLDPGRWSGMFGVWRRQPLKLENQALVPDGKPTLYVGSAYTIILDKCKPTDFIATVIEPPNVASEAVKPEKTVTRVTVTFHSIYAESADNHVTADPTCVSGGTACWTVREHGLPISHEKQKKVGGMVRGLSSSVYECMAKLFDSVTSQQDDVVRRIVAHHRTDDEIKAGITPTCGKPKRSTWVRYEDSSNRAQCGPDSIGECTNSNRREVSSLTEYYDDKLSAPCESYDDAGCNAVYTVVDRSDFDSLGNYRQTVTDGNLLERNGGVAGRSDRRVSYANTNSKVSHSPNGPFSYKPLEWIVNLSSETIETQDGVSNVKRMDYDLTTGFLKAVRTLKSTAPVTAFGVARENLDDLLSTRLREVSSDGKSEIITQYYFGGDGQELVDGFTADGWTYAIETTRQAGTVAKVAYKGKCGQIQDPVLETNDVDSGTGLVKSSTDEFGAKTEYRYDRMGRFTQITPPGETPFVYTYPRLAANDSTDSNVVTMTRSGGAGGDWLFDGYGRLSVMRGDMPSGEKIPNGRIKKVITYTMTGLKWSESVMLKSDHAGIVKDAGGVGDSEATDYHYDIFGRTTTITPTGLNPEDRKTTFEYHGIRATKRRQNGLSVDGFGANGPVATMELFDAHGRMVEVRENVGADKDKDDGDKSVILTRYHHDVGDRLIKVDAPDGGNTDRTWTYDGRGLLQTETHPELDGNEIRWRGYDARGNPGVRKVSKPGDDANVTGPFDVRYEYDCSELLTSVHQIAPGRILKSFKYKGGKVDEASRTNYVVRPTATGQPAEIPVTTKYDYDTSGRITRKWLRAGLETSVQYQYNSLGLVQTATYHPLTPGPGCAAVGGTRTLSYGHSSDHLTTVNEGALPARQWVTGIAYHPNELVAKLTRGNSTLDEISVGADGLPRPSQIQVKQGGTSIWDSGSYVYDGEGTIEKIGDIRFSYDVLRRLTGMVLPGGRMQSYGYDVNGNMTRVAGADIPVNPLTNRLPTAVAVYDDAGNVIQLSDASRRAGFQLRFHEGSGTNKISWYDPLNMPRRMEAYQDENLMFGRIFLYDAADERVAIQQYGGSASGPTVFEGWTLRGTGNEILREFVLSGSGTCSNWRWLKDYVHAGSRLIGTATPNSTPGGPEVVNHYHSDHLGTPRYVTNATGGFVDARSYWAFGEEIDPRSDGNRRKFTGHERDNDGSLSVVGTLDYMHARYYAPAMGRFLSIDPVLGSPSKPQSWNRYSYALNNPSTNTDPTGRQTSYGVGVAGGDVTVEIKAVDDVNHDKGFSGSIEYAPSADLGPSKVKLPGGFEVSVSKDSVSVKIGGAFGVKVKEGEQQVTVGGVSVSRSTKEDFGGEHYTAQPLEVKGKFQMGPVKWKADTTVQGREGVSSVTGTTSIGFSAGVQVKSSASLNITAIYRSLIQTVYSFAGAGHGLDEGTP